MKLMLFMCLVFLMQACGVKQNIAPADNSVGAAEALRVFYTSYIRSCDVDSRGGYDKRQSLKQEYLTESFLTKLKTHCFDYDIFLNAQDCAKEWAETLAVSPTDGAPEAYNVCFNTCSGADCRGQKCVTLFMLKAGGGYKIDGVKDMEKAFFECDN